MHSEQASDIRRAVVVGAGTMGHGIAQVLAAAGCEVWLSDATAAAAQAGIDRIAANLDQGVARAKITPAQRAATLACLHAEADLRVATHDADLIIEAVPEDPDLKRRLLAALSALAPATAILATNTSSIPLRSLVPAVIGAERFVGLHFFNPVPLQPLLEVVRADATAPETLARVLALAARIGKEPIVVRDVAGFASSRLGLALGLEAMRMLEEGVASAADIDTAMRLGYRHPMGPLQLTDLIGLDVRLAIADTLAREIDAVRFAAPQLLRDLVAAGKLGKKSGEGFYRYPPG